MVAAILRIGLIFFGLISIGAFSQTVRWEPASGKFGDGETSTLKLVFDQCSPENDVVLPSVQGLEFGAPSVSKNVSAINFNVTQSTTLSYPVRPNKRGTIEIPVFDVLTNKGVVRVPAARYEVGESRVGDQNARDIIKSFLKFRPPVVWQGEVFHVDYSIYVSQQYEASVIPQFEWTQDVLVVDHWNERETTQAQFDGATFNGLAYKTKACALRAGTFAIPPLMQELNIVVGSHDYGFFSQPNVSRVRVKSQPVTLEVKPLPPAPPEFGGAVGSFTLKSKVLPVELSVGDPVTWTLEFQGTGNWPSGFSLPSRTIPKEWRVIQPKVKPKTEKGKQFEGSLIEDLVLIPSRPGSYTLPGVEVAYFDPASGTYKTLKTDPVTLRISGKALDHSTPSTQTASPASPSSSVSINHSGPILDEPLRFNLSGNRPWNIIYIYLGAFLSVGSILVVLAAFSRKKSWQTDSWGDSRIAAARLLQALDQEKESRRLATMWLDQSAILWGMKEATPTSVTLKKRVSDERGLELALQWEEITAKAEEALCARNSELDDRWREKASELVRQHKIASPRWIDTFYKRNLWPVIFILCCMNSTLVAQTSTLSEAIKDYDRAEWNQASEKVQREIQLDPLNVSARYLNGLIFAQRGESELAAIEFARAFVLAPQEEKARRMTALYWKDSPVLTSQLAQRHGVRGVGSWISPAAALRGMGICLLALAAVILFWIADHHQKRNKLSNRWAMRLVFLLAISLFGLIFTKAAWGVLSDPKAGWVIRETRIYSIPSEADKRSAALPPKVAGVLKREFLGWYRVHLENGVEGWIRQKDWAEAFPSLSQSK